MSQKIEIWSRVIVTVIKNGNNMRAFSSVVDLLCSNNVFFRSHMSKQKEGAKDKNDEHISFDVFFLIHCRIISFHSFFVSFSGDE